MRKVIITVKKYTNSSNADTSAIVKIFNWAFKIKGKKQMMAN